MLVELSLLLSIFLYFFFIFFKTKSNTDSSPKSYPLIGSSLALYTNRHRLAQWTTDYLLNSPTLTFKLRGTFGQSRVITGNPEVVKHILKTQFSLYEKGDNFRTPLSDLLGNGIFNVDGDEWKFQRQVSSHEFNTKTLRHFVEHVVDAELNERLIPILKAAAENDTILDLQDILQRFAFDNICRIAFGYDPKYLTPSLPKAKFAIAFEDAVRISSNRVRMVSRLIWKFNRFLNIGSEKRLKEAVSEIRQFATKILNEKKQDLSSNSSSIQSVDLLSRFLCSGHSDEKFVTDIVISFILAGRDTTSAAMTWFFWLIYKNPDVESKIVDEIKAKSDSPIYDEVKDMVYTHASLCESMRLYPPVPMDTKMANADDVLPDGTVVKKGMVVTYHPYAMGRVEKFWGKDWKDFRPERWLEKDETTEKVKFMARDPYTYPVFQAGPRICLGKDMAFLQMKRVVAGILRQFKVVAAVDDGSEPILTADLTSKMKGGFPVKIKERK
ncbi:cytochrome P450 94A1-like [Rutidosis leptorrhynchoides]|uniref:cytochrome P450 94A1-like n=1 Tax=Rutidosis leptorrhynchoides TaxID=125765 RepID=UPI003A98D6EE